ncbi:hypothetical protein [Bordetella genomosp. 5]|uniref:Uncharacterized protein n=1 Tax=Bordetella genomosp. 5 TaxID=1395608 RepID=A0A261TC20_9BORD|nr:hypothetical protein [Bordetella genomosp. 5]OZI46955.1 hypothetical protein CAL25_20055 [Bordetella genomosp. 5]
MAALDQALNNDVAAIDLNEVADRLDVLESALAPTCVELREMSELQSVIRQTAAIDACDYFTPVMYRHDRLPEAVSSLVDVCEVTFFDTTYYALSTVAA